MASWFGCLWENLLSILVASLGIVLQAVPLQITFCCFWVPFPISFLELPKQMITNWVAYNNRNLLFRASGGQRSELKMPARLVALVGCEGGSMACLSPGFGGCCQPQASLAHRHVTSVSAPVVTWCVLSVTLSLFSLLMMLSVVRFGHTLVWYDLIVTNYVCKDSTSKSGHILRFQVDMNFGGTKGSPVPPFCFVLWNQ